METYLRVNLLGPGPHLTKKKKNLPGRGLTKVEKHWCRYLSCHETRPSGNLLTNFDLTFI